MIKHPEYQNQHRVSQVYLRHFGADDRISVYQKFKPHTDNLSIQKFTADTNIFDLPFENYDDKRYLEIKTSKIENDYNKIVKTLTNQRRLIPEHKEVLIQFIAALICKTKAQQEFFQGLIDDERCKLKFLQEVSMFRKGEYEILEFCIDLIDKKDRLNMVLCSLLEHLILVLRQFECIIFEDFDNRGWVTADNPVIIDKQNIFEWILPWESEIYFPISRDFCLLLFSNHSEIKTTSFRNLAPNKIYKATDEIHTSISKKYFDSYTEFIIFPTLVENINLDEVE